jgi:hypothetical protein
MGRGSQSLPTRSLGKKRACIPINKNKKLTLQTTWITSLVTLCSTCCTKISVLLLYRRILAPSYKSVWNFAVWAAISVTTAYWVAGIFSLCFICDPLWAYWMSFDLTWDAAWHCADGQWMNYSTGIISVVSDFYAIALPLAILENTELHISWKQRWTTYLFFCLGIRYVIKNPSQVHGAQLTTRSVVTAGIGKTYWLVQLGDRPDTSWTGGSLLIWCIAEMQLAIICACAPAVRMIFVSVRRYSISSHSFSRQNRQNNDGNQASTDKSQNGFVALESVKSLQTTHVEYRSEASESAS